MSELLDTTAGRKFRRELLTTVCAIALIASCGEALSANTSENEPRIWIELGGQLEHLDRDFLILSPPFAQEAPNGFDVLVPNGVQQPPRYTYGGEASISFEPTGGWVFSAAVRYGRSNGVKHRHVEISGVITSPGARQNTTDDPRFADSRAKFGESHAILDFKAGRDLGLGLFGTDGTSTLSLGVRIAQFQSRSDVTLSSDPDYHFKKTQLVGVKYLQAFHLFTASASSRRSFHGVGPSVSWTGVTPITGNRNDESFSFEWGVNAAVLFGRQKQKIHHSTSAGYYSIKYTNKVNPIYARSNNVVRSRSLVVPNLGGFAGLSLNFPNAKIGVGYRADFFFGAMDGGIDTRKTFDRDFYGPFATISLGLGG